MDRKSRRGPRELASLPYNPDAEQAVLGGLLLAAHREDRESLSRFVDALRPEDFFSPQNRMILTAIGSAHAVGNLPDLITVTDDLRRAGELEKAGGAVYITKLLDATFGPSTLPQHTAILREHAEKRFLAEAALSAYEGAINGESSEAIVSFLRRTIDGSEEIRFVDPSKEGAWGNRIVSAAELMAGPETGQMWWPLWGQPGLIGPGLVTLVSGHSKAAGKSTSLAIGIRDLLRQHPHLRVLVLTEEPRSIWHSRLLAWGLDLPGLRFRFADGTPWPGLLREIELPEIDLLVVDTLRSFAGIQDENDASRVVESVQPLGLMARRKNMSATIAHHLRKADDTGAGLSHAGSTALVALADVALELRQENNHSPNRRTLRAVSRFDETPRALTLELRGHEIVPLGTPEAVTLHEVTERVFAVLPSDGVGWTRDEIKVALDEPQPSPEQVSRALRTLLADDRAIRSGKGVRGDPHRWATKKSNPLPPLLGVEESNSR